VDEVKSFIDVIDTLRDELLPNIESDNAEGKIHPLIAVHCHYGFNRTGFFLIAYMVERLHWHLKDAIAEFAGKRAPGVRHEYFLDELWGRYWISGEDRDRARIASQATM
jgi:protein-tyrosine phosphatase